MASGRSIEWDMIDGRKSESLLIGGVFISQMVIARCLFNQHSAAPCMNYLPTLGQTITTWTQGNGLVHISHPMGQFLDSSNLMFGKSTVVWVWVIQCHPFWGRRDQIFDANVAGNFWIDFPWTNSAFFGFGVFVSWPLTSLPWTFVRWRV